MKNDIKPFNYIISFYIECTDDDYIRVKNHFKSLAEFHYLEPLWVERMIDDECVFERKIYSIHLALRKSYLSRHHYTTQLRKLFEADLRLIQQSLILYDLEFLKADPIQS